MPHFTLRRQNGTVRWDPHTKTFVGWKTHTINFLNNSDVTVDVEIAEALEPVPGAINLGPGKKGDVHITADATNAPKPDGGKHSCKTSTASQVQDGDPVIIIKP